LLCTEQIDSPEVEGKLEETIVKSEPDKPYFQLGDNTYTDGSTAPIEDLMHNENPLMCVTQYRPCCNEDSKGEFYFPDDTAVPMIDGESLYMSRDDEGSIVMTQGKSRTADPPTGSYCCEIPDSTGQTTRICLSLVHEWCKNNIEKIIV